MQINTKTLHAFSLPLLLLATPVITNAHEFWLDPTDYHPKVNETVKADIRNGQHFSGTRFPYSVKLTRSLYLVSPDTKSVIKGRLGDYPAVQHQLATPGLNVIVFTSTQQSLVYKSLKKFTTFLDYHGLTDLKSKHLSEGKPYANIREKYTRFTKAYVQVGHEDTDNSSDNAKQPDNSTPALQAQGMLLELVPLTSPYTNDTSLQVKLLYQGKPLANRQIETFIRTDEVRRFTTSSDNNGMATINLESTGKYMINVVHVVEPDSDDHDWKSLWFSLTFNRSN